MPSGTARAALQLALGALHESSDFNPVLKAVMGGLQFLFNVAETARSNRDECERLAVHAAGLASEIMRLPQGETLFLRRAATLQKTLEAMGPKVQTISRRNRKTRLLFQAQDKAVIQACYKDLDECMIGMSAFGHLDTQLCVRAVSRDLHGALITMDESAHQRADRLESKLDNLSTATQTAPPDIKLQARGFSIELRVTPNVSILIFSVVLFTSGNEQGAPACA